MKICLIDNYDSFTFNLEHQLASFDIDVDVIRNDDISIKELEENNYDAYVLGPGPSNPKNAGICLDLIKHFYQTNTRRMFRTPMYRRSIWCKYHQM